MHLLVIRTSAMGDVALTTPVLRAFVNQYPAVQITLVTRSSFKPFLNSINNLQLFCPDFTDRHKGLTGLIRLFRDLRKHGRYDHVIDLHNVLRSKMLMILFRFSGIPVSVIDKGRADKRNIIKGIIKVQLKHSAERYNDVFSTAGFPVKFEPVDGLFHLQMLCLKHLD